MNNYYLDGLVSHAGTTAMVKVPHETFLQMHNMIKRNICCYIQEWHEVEDVEQSTPEECKKIDEAVHDLAILAATTQSTISALGRKLCPSHIAEFIISMVGIEAFRAALKHEDLGALQ